MKKKQWIGIALAALTSATAFAGCGGGQEQNTGDPSIQPTGSEMIIKTLLR